MTGASLLVAAAAAGVLVACSVIPHPGLRHLLEQAPPIRRVRLDRAVACELLAVILAAGSSVPDALATLGEAMSERELVICARLLRWGAEWEDATMRVPRALRAVLEPLRAAWIGGVDPGPALRTTAATWRARRAARARESAERLAVRLVLPLGLCLLPAFVLLGLVPVALAAASSLLGHG